ncbi:MAG TPA: hypothetical protein VEL07_20480 [Planctomycetota bacterium]|nr:hypothetical protein [Planctomycetota bacterium]
MPLDLSRHPFFTPWTEPASGVLSWILTERAAATQQGFYFVNPGIAGDERYLWFYAGWPPTPSKCLGVVSLDPEDPFIRTFPTTFFQKESPLVAADGRSCFFCSGNGVWRQGLDGDPEPVLAMPEEILRKRPLRSLATHLTISADGRYLLLDTHVGSHWLVAIGEIATGAVEVLKEWPAHHDHAQFSPRDPDLFLIAQDWWHDPTSGTYFGYDHRTWLMDVRRTRYEPLSPKDWYEHGTDATRTRASHEWWGADGSVCWVDYDKGVFSLAPDAPPGTRPTHVWKGPLCHAHSDPSMRYWVADESPYRWTTQPCEVRFFDRERDAVTVIAALPKPPVPRHPLHLDPHPHFSSRGNWVIYTTTVMGRVDVALTPTGSLAAG